jgi:hypothetical protein
MDTDGHGSGKGLDNRHFERGGQSLSRIRQDSSLRSE